MKEIKFRAFDKESKKMFLVNKLLWGAYPIEPFQAQGIIVGDEIKVMNICEDDCEQKTPHCKLMQYIGLKDKNGVLIYEGDIITHTAYPLDRVKVEYIGTAFRGGGMLLESYHSSVIEIIGNIYENENLLK